MVSRWRRVVLLRGRTVHSRRGLAGGHARGIPLRKGTALLRGGFISLRRKMARRRQHVVFFPHGTVRGRWRIVLRWRKTTSLRRKTSRQRRRMGVASRKVIGGPPETAHAWLGAAPLRTGAAPLRRKTRPSRRPAARPRRCCAATGTAPGVGDLLFAGMVNGAALTAGFGFGVISFSETIAMAGGETYRLTAYQNSGWQLDITGGAVVIERLGEGGWGWQGGRQGLVPLS